MYSNLALFEVGYSLMCTVSPLSTTFKYLKGNLKAIIKHFLVYYTVEEDAFLVNH